MKESIENIFSESASIVARAGKRLAGRIAQAVDLVVECYGGGGGLLVFGNGGSAADAQHIVGELVGRLMFDRPPLKAEALASDPACLTCLANDYGYEQVFARQIAGKGSPGDVAIALSTSGNSPNVVAALAEARRIGMKTIVFTGPGGGRCAALADVLLDVEGSDLSPRIQEAHAVIYHAVCQLVEARVFGTH
jgi:D-sedoheptulose 7-phosphate isomerase